MAMRASAILLGVFLAAMQILVLPPDGFVTGDQGSKFLQARAFADNGPLDPGIDVLSRDIDPEYRHQEPKLKSRRGRLVSEFLWLLPLATAPFLRAFGMYGLYVVPALSAIAIFFAAASLARRLGESPGLWTACVAVLATPVLFYALEHWEHAPAAACVLIAAALLAPGARSETRGGTSGRAATDEEGDSTREIRGTKGRASSVWSGAWLSVGGAAIMTGALFREEVITALPALVVARALSVRRDRIRDLVTTSLWTSLGAAVVFAASMPVNWTIYGTLLPMHVTQDAWEVAKATPYMQVRRDVLFDLLLPRTAVAWFAAAAITGVAASVIQWIRTRADRPNRDAGASSRGLLAIVHVSVTVMLVIAIVLPAWRIAHGVQPYAAYNVHSAAHTWPFALLVLYWPWLRPADQSGTARFLVISAILVLAATALIVPTSGGAQWSPRFLLAGAPLLAIAAAAAARVAMARSVLWRSIAASVLLSSVAAQMEGLRYMAEAKGRNAHILHRVAQLSNEGNILISDIFWLPEVVAPLSSTRRILFAWSPADVEQAATLAARHGFRTLAVVVSSGETGYRAPGVLHPGDSSCMFIRNERLAIGERGLVLHRYSCGDTAVVK